VATGVAVELERPLPPSLPVGRGTAVFCYGHCFDRDRDVERLEIAVDGRSHAVSASGMPRLDLLRALEEPQAYRSGFWATIPIEPRDRPGTVGLAARVRLEDGSLHTAELATIRVVEPDPPPSYELPHGAGNGLIAVCMATFDPDIELLQVQIESLREQSDTDWICLISDDCSQPDRYEAMLEIVAGDPRFVVSRADQTRGFYRNFERALEMVPAEAELVALCDQDDRWYADKLEVLRGAIGGSQLVYSDQRLVDPSGGVLRETFWEGRRRNHTNFASLLIANTIVGASSLFRAELLELALPFPEGLGWEFHDHWLATVALATGEIRYVDRPLYDYVQHPGAVLGRVGSDEEAGRRRWRLPRVRGLFSRWRSAYFFGYVPLEVQAQALATRCRARLTARKRRVLSRFISTARSPLAFAWLAARPARELVGRNETLGTEALLTRGILWRHLIRIRLRGRRTPGGATYDASLPSPHSYDHRRLRRWQAAPLSRVRAREGPPAPRATDS
jgi:glycosyltransferase involved in cell wall biosynthesis